MRGGRWLCLLVFFLVMLPAAPARGQGDGARATKQIRAGQSASGQVAAERGTAEHLWSDQLAAGLVTTGPVTSERVTSDKVAADFVRSLAAVVLPGEAERSRPMPPLRPVRPIGTWGAIGLPQIVRAAGTIFSGTVTSIARRPATRGQAIETVAITFHVERAIRGATAGEDFTISQWMGLWSSGQRYRVGERVLLFLYPASKLGLTSCVAAPMGRFAIDPAGRVLLTAQHLAAFRTDPVLGGKSRARFSDFALAVRRASEAE